MPTPVEWLNESQANTGAAATGNQSAPQIIGLSNGNILVAWEDDILGVVGSAGDRDIIGKIFSPDGTVVVDSFRLNASRTADNESEFSIAATNDGGFIIVYVDNDISNPNNSDLVFERKSASGTQTAFGTIVAETSATTTLVDPSVAVNLSDNSFLVTWTSIENGDDNVRGRHFSPTNVGGVEFAAGQSGVDDDLDSDTVILTNGNYVTVYEEVDAGVPGVEFKINTSAGGFVANQNISSGANVDPAVASLTNGNWVVVWTDTDTGNGDIAFQIFTGAGGQVTTVQTAASGANFQNEPMVVALPDGGFVIAWDNDTNGTLEAQAFTAAGVPDGSPVIISPVAATSPSASVTADGRVAFAWVTESSPEIFWSIWDPRGGVINYSTYDLNLPNFLETTVVQPGIGENTITGTSANDSMLGGSVNDTIFGGASADFISGFGGSDEIYGGDGNDTIFGGAAFDEIFGNNNDDLIVIFDGDDVDAVFGGAGTDTLDLSDIVTDGGAINIDLESNTMTGLGGTVAVDSIEVVIGTALDDTIFADAGADTIYGGAGNDTLGGGFAEDALFGGSGNDRFVIRAGEFLDNVDGGSEVDTLDVSALSTVDYSGAIVNFETGVISTGFATGGSVTVASVEVYIDNAGSNEIFDSFADMSIFGGDGNDTITENALGGVDIFDLGGGDDRLVIQNVGIGAGDIFNGGTGNDTIDFSNVSFTAGTGVVIDLLDGNIRNGIGGIESILDFENAIGSAGVETIEGTNNGNFLDGRDGDDTIFGLDGNDTLVGGAGADSIDGGAGTGDTADYSVSNSAISIGFSLIGAGGHAQGDTLTSIEHIIGSSFNDTLFGGSSSGLTIEGGDGADQIFDDAGNNFLFGGVGNNDVIFGSGGADTIDGGAGIGDTVRYAGSAFGVTVNLASGIGVGGDAAGDTYAGIENVVGSAFDDSLLGDDAANQLFGLSGSNYLEGRGGADTLEGGTGNDTLVGGAGADSLMGGDGARDLASYFDSAIGLRADLQVTTFNTGDALGDTYSGIEDLFGSGFGDSLLGDAGANIIWGEAGNDSYLDGRIGNDTIYGGTGNDVMIGGWGADLLDGGAGTRDRVQYTDSTVGLRVDIQVTTFNTGIAVGDVFVGVEDIYGSFHGDTLLGDTANNIIWGEVGNDAWLDGRIGNDTVYGGAGNDVLIGGAGADLLDGGTGTRDRVQYTDSTVGLRVDLQVAATNTGVAAGDTFVGIEDLFGGFQSDSLLGNTEGNIIWGAAGNDLIDGRLGNDTLLGGAGNDTLIGGSGADVFIFETALGATNVDSISSYAVADDTIQLENAIFTALTATGTLAATAFATGAVATTAAHRILYNSANGQLLYDADGNGAGAAVLVATLNTGLAMTAGEFLVV